MRNIECVVAHHGKRIEFPEGVAVGNVALRNQSDLAHDVFLVAYRRLPHYDVARPIRPWLFGISYRVLADERRRGRRKEIPGGAAIEVPDGAPPADEQAVRNQERDVLLRLLASLPIELCAVLVLHDLEGRVATDIAQTLEIPMNTVYSRLRRAREAFAAAADLFRAGGGPR